ALDAARVVRQFDIQPVILLAANFKLMHYPKCGSLEPRAQVPQDLEPGVSWLHLPSGNQCSALDAIPLRQSPHSGRRQPGSGRSLAGRLAGLAYVLKTLEKGRIGRPRCSVQSARLDGKLRFSLRQLGINLLRVR